MILERTPEFVVSIDKDVVHIDHLQSRCTICQNVKGVFDIHKEIENLKEELRRHAFKKLKQVTPQ